MKDYSHLATLEAHLSRERNRLANAKTEKEKALRQVWVAQLEKEVEGEKKFLGVEESNLNGMSDEDLLKALLG